MKIDIERFGLKNVPVNPETQFYLSGRNQPDSRIAGRFRFSTRKVSRPFSGCSRWTILIGHVSDCQPEALDVERPDRTLRRLIAP